MPALTCCCPYVDRPVLVLLLSLSCSAVFLLYLITHFLSCPRGACSCPAVVLGYRSEPYRSACGFLLAHLSSCSCPPLVLVCSCCFHSFCVLLISSSGHSAVVLLLSPDLCPSPLVLVLSAALAIASQSNVNSKGDEGKAAHRAASYFALTQIFPEELAKVGVHRCGKLAFTPISFLASKPCGHSSLHVRSHRGQPS